MDVDLTPDVHGDHLGSPESAAGQSRENDSSALPAADGSRSISLVRRGTGPRTQQGKERSKRNALRHGLFSKLLLLKTESRSDFNALHNGLREDRQPVGVLGQPVDISKQSVCENRGT